METRTVFFIGKPGCGKGTQAKLLAESTGWPVFGSGKLFREIAQEDTPAGRRVKKETEAGLLGPHWFAMYLYLKSLFSIPAEASAIFDGFNRKTPEAELIIASLKWLERPYAMIHVIVSDDEVRRRLALRGASSGRADDGAIEERIKEYYEHTEKAVALFRAAGVLVDIGGERAPEAIAADVRAALHL
jgi:adenylate kinase